MNVIRLKTKINLEDLFKFLLVLIWTRTILTSYAYQFMLRIPLLEYIADLTKGVVFICATCFALPILVKRLKLSDYVIGIIVILGYFISMRLFPRTEAYLMKNWIDILCINFSLYYVGVCMDKDEYVDLLYKWSRICIFAVFIYFCVFGFQAEVGRNEAENMGIAYRLLPHLVMLTYYTIKFKRKYDIMLLVIGFVLLLACGTRGPVVSAVLFMLVYFLFFYNSNKKWLSVGVLAFFAFLISIDIRIIIEPLTAMLNQFGFSTRVVDAFLAGEIANDNGRNEIVLTMMNMLKENNYHGFGLAGDRGVVSWMAYSHNIVIEMWISFGLLLGTIIIVLLSYVLIRAFFQANRVQKEFLLVLIFGGGLFKLMISSSFLLEYLFFFMMGYCICIIRKKRKTRFPKEV